MKFLYEYRTPDNAKHNGVICASDREAAYAALKQKGIKPSRFAEAPGFFNKLFGKGKRWIAIGALGILCAVLAVIIRSTPKYAEIDSTARRHPIGDAEVIDRGIRTGWASVFPEEGERFLASFAVPGTPAGLRSTTEEEVKAALSRKIEVSADDSIEARQIKSMVEGMKRELREFLADGGTVKQYGRRLVQRQEAEIGYYHRAKAAVDAAVKDGKSDAAIAELLDKHNASLRRMGIRPVILPQGE